MDATNTAQGYVPPSQLKVGQVLLEKKRHGSHMIWSDSPGVGTSHYF